MNKTKSMRFMVMIIACYIGSANGVGVPKSLQGMHGDADYPAACSATELAKLKAAVTALSAERQPDDAWQVAKAVLCGDSQTAERFILTHMPQRIASNTYSTGDEKETVAYIDRSTSVLLRKQAWGAEVAARDGDIVVSYRPDAACVGGFSLRFNGRGWLLVGADIACD